jgi:branched-chain amino acid transport system substrate-binding protein
MKRLTIPALVVLLVALAGCGGGQPDSKLPVVTLWSSLPHRGPDQRQALLMERAIRGAVGNLQGRFDGYRLRYIALDSSSAGTNGWDPGIAAANARRAALDPSSFAYIGELDSGATAVALPILNQAGVLLISPSATAVGLTNGGVGAGPGAPFQYYPSGRRSSVRLVPRDSLQGALIPEVARGHRCKTLAVIDDGSIYGAGLAAIVESEAPARGLTITYKGTLDPRASDYARSVYRVRGACILYAGEPKAAAVRVVTDAARHNKSSLVIAPDALASPAFADPLHGGISAALAKRTFLIGTVGGEAAYPPFGQWLWRNLTNRGENLVGTGVIPSYAAVELAVACQERSGLVKGRPDKAGILGCALGHNHYSRALGEYRAFLRGDTSVHSYSQLGIKAGRLKWLKPLHAPRPLSQSQIAAAAKPTG